MSLNPINIVDISSSKHYIDEDGNVPYNMAEIERVGKANARIIGNEKNIETNTYVYNESLSSDILITGKGIRHGIYPKSRRGKKSFLRAKVMNAIAGCQIGELVKNAVAVNELAADSGFVLISMARMENMDIPVRIILKDASSGLEIENYDFQMQTHALNAKRIAAAESRKNEEDRQVQHNVPSSTINSSIISVQELLKKVNTIPEFRNSLSDDVLGYMGESKKDEGRNNLKYSLPDPDSVNDYINSHETEFVEVPPVRDYEREGAAARAQSIEELQEKVKDTDNINLAKNPNIRFSLKEDADITYGSLVAKSDMKVANIMNQDLSAYKNIKAREGRLDTGPGSRTPQTAMALAEEVQMLRRQNKEQEKEIRRLEEKNKFLEEASAFFAASRRKSAKGRE